MYCRGAKSRVSFKYVKKCKVFPPSAPQPSKKNTHLQGFSLSFSDTVQNPRKKRKKATPGIPRKKAGGKSLLTFFSSKRVPNSWPAQYPSRLCLHTKMHEILKKTEYSRTFLKLISSGNLLSSTLPRPSPLPLLLSRRMVWDGVGWAQGSEIRAWREGIIPGHLSKL